MTEPLERGFGLTLGNALPLLSSLQGAAITSIKIENVLHEFSSLAGVREDVTDIVQRQADRAAHAGRGASGSSSRRPAGRGVTAGDIAVTGDIEVMNKDLVICRSTRQARQWKLTSAGKGYAPRGQPSHARAIGLFPIDSPLAGAPGQLQG